MEKNNLFQKNALERISSPERLNRYIKITTPSVVVLVAAMLLLLAGAVVWAFMAVLPVTVLMDGIMRAGENGGTVEAVICVADNDTASLMREGMLAQVAPASTERDSYEHIVGRVSSVSKYPVSIDELAEIAGNTELAQSIYSETGLRLVMIELVRDEKSAGGLKWVGGTGEDTRVEDAMPATARVVIKEMHPIDLVWG